MTHGAGAFEAGDSVILTLKDQALLEEDEHGRVTGLKDEEDELENVQMKEAEVGHGRTKKTDYRWPGLEDPKRLSSPRARRETEG